MKILRTTILSLAIALSLTACGTVTTPTALSTEKPASAQASTPSSPTDQKKPETQAHSGQETGVKQDNSQPSDAPKDPAANKKKINHRRR